MNSSPCLRLVCQEYFVRYGHISRLACGMLTSYAGAWRHATMLTRWDIGWRLGASLVGTALSAWCLQFICSFFRKSPCRGVQHMQGKKIITFRNEARGFGQLKTGVIA